MPVPVPTLHFCDTAVIFAYVVQRVLKQQSALQSLRRNAWQRLSYDDYLNRYSTNVSCARKRKSELIQILNLL